MKRIKSILLTVALIFNIVFCCGITVNAASNSVSFSIETAKTTGKTIGNLTGYMNTWGYDYLRNIQSDGEADLSFVEYIEIMTATGGSNERDLIDANGNMIESRLNALAEACQGVLNLGAKPLLKLGCIPFYFSTQANPEKKTGGSFGYNVFPPDEGRYEEYQLYLENVIQYMIDRFGIDEVRSWRYGVMTEYENDEWFFVLDSRGKIDTNATKQAFFKIYDYSVQALENKLGAENVFVGAHSMTVTEGIWDEREFIAHAANGYNYAKGKNGGTQIDYLSFSFYDASPERYTSGMTLAQCVNFLRDYAVSQGLTNLKYGIDEGRILSGVNRGAGSDALNTRCVGHIWQAGYDARMFKTMLDSDIDYFCVWSWTSDLIGKGYPTVSYHVADSVSKMIGDERVNVIKASSNLISGLEAETFASYDKSSSTAKIMSYNFKNDIMYHDLIDMKYNVNLPDLAGQAVKVKRYVIDESASYFDEWWGDREKYGITDDKFNWSPDDPTIDSYATLSDQASRDLYYNNLREKYMQCAKLTPTEYTAGVDSNGNLSIEYDSMRGNAVVYYEISPEDRFEGLLYSARSLDPNDYMDFSEINSLLKKANSTVFDTQQKKDEFSNELQNALDKLVKLKRCGNQISLNSGEVNYPYAYLLGKLTVEKADEATSFYGSSNNDSGNPVYMLDGNDTYDVNNFHVWQRTFNDSNPPNAVFYLDRYSYGDVAELGNIIKAEYTTWGRNHLHSIGIGDTNVRQFDGTKTIASVTGSKSNTYTYALINPEAGSQYSQGSQSSLTYTPDGETIKSTNSAAITGSVPDKGESVTLRVGIRTGVIDGYGWGNYINYYSYTNITFVGYDTTELRNTVLTKPDKTVSYTLGSYTRYENTLKKATHILNNSHDQSEIDSVTAELKTAYRNLKKDTNILYGDVNLDGKLDATDAILVKCIFEDMLTFDNLTDVQYSAADYDRNGVINDQDAEMLINKGLYH